MTWTGPGRARWRTGNLSSSWKVSFEIRARWDKSCRSAQPPSLLSGERSVEIVTAVPASSGPCLQGTKPGQDFPQGAAKGALRPDGVASRRQDRHHQQPLGLEERALAHPLRGVGGVVLGTEGQGVIHGELLGRCGEKPPWGGRATPWHQAYLTFS